MKFLSLLALVAGCALLQLAVCQLQCGDLAVENDAQPMSGSGLTFCRNDSAQCCVQNYIDSVTEVARNRLSRGLRLQMRETSLTFNNTIDMIKNYFNMYFRGSFVGSLPSLPGGGSSFDQLINATIGPTIMQFVQNLQTADVSQFITNVNNAIGNAAGTLLGGGNEDTQMCVRRLIASNINQTDIAVVIRGLMNVQRALNSLDRIADFLYQYRMNTEFRFPQNCVRRFVELNFCARCMRRIPPLCSNTCGALYRGCLSPYYTVLSRQFDLLFNVSRQVLRVTNNTLQDLFMNERRLIDITQAGFQLLSQCQITLPGQPGKRQAPTPNARVRFIPQERMQELRNLTGRGFTYDNRDGPRGPIICRPSADEETFCMNPRMRGQNASDFCDATVDCTSSCRCFDGMNPRMTNTDEFTMNGIDGQANNPAINLMESELMSIVTEIGNPASSFLMQDTFTSTIPDGVVLPSDDDGSGSVHTAVSMMALLLALVAAMLF